MNLSPEWAPDPYILVLTGAGLLIALVAWLPLALKRLPLSLPIVCIGLGAAIFALPAVTLRPLPMHHPEIAERFSEFVVIIALMGAGLKIDRVFGFRSWSVSWRLIAITMPLGIAAITATAGLGIGLPWTVALLLGAALAPTDPVLAADVQVGPPKTGEEDEVRFGLTSEAGLNDGFAFPFVHLAIVLWAASRTGEPWLGEWLATNVVWEIAAGTAAGYGVGRLFGWLTFHVPTKGTPLGVTLSGANQHDSMILALTLDAVPGVRRGRGRPRRRPAKLHADKGYDYKRCHRECRTRSVTPHIAHRGNESGQKLGRHRWVVERTFAWRARFRRLAVLYGRKAASFT